jgi:hypothetical protein
MTRDQRVRELPLRLHDPQTVPLERAPAGSARPQLLAISDQPSEEILEGFDWERRLPVEGSDGARRGDAYGAFARPSLVSALTYHFLSPFRDSYRRLGSRLEALVGAAAG